MDEDSDDAHRKVIVEFKARRLLVDAPDNFSTVDVFRVCLEYSDFNTVSLSYTHSLYGCLQQPGHLMHFL